MFAISVGTLTTRRVKDNFRQEVVLDASGVADGVKDEIPAGPFSSLVLPGLLSSLPAPAEARLISFAGAVASSTTRLPVAIPTPLALHIVPGGVGCTNTTWASHILVTCAVVDLTGIGPLYLQYLRPLSEVNPTVARVELFLLIGVLGGTGLAFGAGAWVARRAMAPIAALTVTAREIERTRDPSLSVPVPETHDEIAELSSTLAGMLTALTDARAEAEAMLTRQREFVADASHELRTPLTSVLANLELLSESLPGEDGDAARSALRSSHRMRRLVEDLLLLARADTGRAGLRGPLDLADIVTDAAAELGPISATHNVALDPQSARLEGSRDDLQRVAINLIENAVRHTPPGTDIRVVTRTAGAGQVELVVEDDGPGVPDNVAPRLFERFVRGTGDRGGSFGLGLAIVAAVAASHHGTVSLGKSASGGARFVVTLPVAVLAPVGEAAPA